VTVPELEASGIIKRYGALLANDRIDLAVARGEVHGVIGENGAGKSTLMSILYGLQRPDAGEICLRGQPVRFRSPTDAIAQGMGMVHQAFKLFGPLMVWENIVYGREPRRGLLLDRAAARRQVRELAARFGLPVDPDALVADLPVGIRQRVEILKALYRDARVLILDEPTAVLTPQERDGLFAVIRELVADRRTVLFVTHKLPEIMALTDRVTVLRDGRVVARLVTRETSAEEIVHAMTGRNLAPLPQCAPATPGAALLEVRGLTVRGEGLRKLVDGLGFVLHGGEILGLAGVAGNGQTELVQALVGLRRPDSGEVRVNGRRLSQADVAAHRAAGLAYVPEDRADAGSAAAASVADNLAMGLHRRPPLAKGWRRGSAAVRAHARALIRRFDIRIADERVAAGTLSGGNLQKLVLGRELSQGARVLLVEQPTRGLDVGAAAFIHEQLAAERAAGRGVLLVSAELAEILALSDRVLVMYEGRIVAELPRAQASEQRLGLLMAGQLDAAA
jgi:simple sugar transport system ATP-binding protein